jgi:hypothetical protein
VKDILENSSVHVGKPLKQNETIWAFPSVYLCHYLSDPVKRFFCSSSAKAYFFGILEKKHFPSYNTTTSKNSSKLIVY